MIAWEATDEGHVRFITDEQYRAMKPQAREAYKPYRCPVCQDTTKAFEDVQAERMRQIAREGFNYHHDDIQTEHELERAAASYAWYVAEPNSASMTQPPLMWPWDAKWWKPKNERQDLVRAAALLIAAIERYDREAAAVKQPQVKDK